jgi:hypothetical protein
MMATTLPAFIEFEPDNFKPIEECSPDELGAAAHSMMAHALMAAREAVESAEREGPNAMNAEMMRHSEEQMAIAESIAAYAGVDLSVN